MNKDKLRLYSWSDLHIDIISTIQYEQLEKQLFSTLSLDTSFINIILLTGDISNPFHPHFIRFFKIVSETFDHVIYIAGNHEYYTKDINRTMNVIKDQIVNKLSIFTNVIFLDNKCITLYGYTFIGSTLWSHIDLDKVSFIKRNINDYHKIYKIDKLIKISDTNELNKIAIEFLFITIPKYDKCIILTHHAPLFSDPKINLFTADVKYLNSLNNSAFHNNLIDMIKPPIVLWVYGHTHYRGKSRLNDVTLWTNQLGYIREIDNMFDPNDHIDLDVI